jgi:hypothetical protein
MQVGNSARPLFKFRAQTAGNALVYFHNPFINPKTLSLLSKMVNKCLLCVLWLENAVSSQSTFYTIFCIYNDLQIDIIHYSKLDIFISKPSLDAFKVLFPMSEVCFTLKRQKRVEIAGKNYGELRKVWQKWKSRAIYRIKENPAGDGPLPTPRESADSSINSAISDSRNSGRHILM